MSILKRLFGKTSAQQPTAAAPDEAIPVDLPFGVGDRVRDSWGNEHTVLEIDPEAEMGLGLIRTRRVDGTEVRVACVAHGLEKIPQ